MYHDFVSSMEPALFAVSLCQKHMTVMKAIQLEAVVVRTQLSALATVVTVVKIETPLDRHHLHKDTSMTRIISYHWRMMSLTSKQETLGQFQ